MVKLIIMTGNIPQHAHCLMCGKSVPFGETLCSEECKQKYQTLTKRRKLIVYLMYGMLAALIVIFVVGGRYL
jgi:predicted nucleic acid-binding Zn ribbon protein